MRYIKRAEAKDYSLESKGTSKSNEYEVTLKSAGRKLRDVTFVTTSTSAAYFRQPEQSKSGKKVS